MATKQQTWIVLLVLIAVMFVAGNWKPSQPLSILYVPLALASGQSTVTIGVNQGQGQICGNDLTSGVNKCTSSSIDLPVNQGDQVTFTATASQGYAFAQFEGPGGITATSNPLTVTIVQQQGAIGFVKADFATCQNNVCNLTVTATPGGIARTTTTSYSVVQGSQPSAPSIGSTQNWFTGTSFGVPNWFLAILVLLTAILLVRLLRS